jgi:8-oxo-dGTP diphosphatase
VACDVRRVRCVGGLVRDERGSILLVERANEPGRGLWSIPGGRVEAGESDAQALRRELAEETGLDVEVGDMVGHVERPGPDGVTYDIYDYECVVTGGVVRAGDDALQVAFTPGDVVGTLPTTDQLVETLRSWGWL